MARPPRDDFPEHTIAEAAEILGVLPARLREWESMGVIQRARRRILGGASYRCYNANDIDALRIVIEAYQREGLRARRQAGGRAATRARLRKSTTADDRTR